MADPRGCDYREIEVGTGEIWHGDGGIVKTHGWILPGQTEPRFAVCWNGLVYPVVSIGDTSDWRADVRAAMKNAGRQWASALPEAHGVSHETARPLKGCLILRLGDAQLAEDFWLAIQAGAQRAPMALNAKSGLTNPTGNATAKLDEADPYLNWASDWAWDLYDRAVCADMRGDDRLALASARSLEAARPKIEAAAGERGFKRQPTFTSPSDGKFQDYVNFLGPLPVLLADQERRGQRQNPVQSPATITNLVSRPEPISVVPRRL